MEMRMGAFMIHHSEELMMVSQHLNIEIWVREVLGLRVTHPPGVSGSAPKPRICYSPASYFGHDAVVCLPAKPCQRHHTQGL